MLDAKQHFDLPPPVDVTGTLAREFAAVRDRLRPNARIGVAIGSRGIARLRECVVTLLELLKQAGAQPFILPAMGSHGGATPMGQREILAEYGVTEEELEVPIHGAMDVQPLGITPEGMEVCWSTEALNADGIVVVNRIKPHTDFQSDTLGSGLLKMLVVGLGKHHGAARYHAATSRWGYERITRSAARIILDRAPVLFGVGIVENPAHAIATLAVVPAEEFERREAELFAAAKRWMPRLPFDEIDLLIVDRMGKNISGTGMDPALLGRHIHGYSSALNRDQKPIVRRVFVRELTPETHGNGIGIGLADFTTTRLVQSLNWRATYKNVLTSLALNCVKLPIHFETDREVITHALASLALDEPGEAKVVRIRDTLSLSTFRASASCLDLIEACSTLQATSKPEAMDFGPDGNLLPMRRREEAETERD